jgi:hypothetical protein
MEFAINLCNYHQYSSTYPYRAADLNPFAFLEFWNSGILEFWNLAELRSRTAIEYSDICEMDSALVEEVALAIGMPLQE